MTALPDLHNAYRLECKSRKPQRLSPDFYLTVFEGLKEREEKADKYLKEKNLEDYVSLKTQVGLYRRDLRTFMEKRLEKLLIMSLYDLENSEVRFLPEEEELRLTVKGLTEKFIQTGEMK